MLEAYHIAIEPLLYAVVKRWIWNGWRVALVMIPSLAVLFRGET